MNEGQKMQTVVMEAPPPFSPKKESRVQRNRILASLFVFLTGVGLFWYFHQSNGFHLPVQSLKDPYLVTLRDLDIKPPLQQFWKEHVFKSHTSYQIENGSLHASSQGTSSMLYQEVNIPLSKRPFLTWEWKAVQFPGNKTGRNLADKSNNDFAGRVYAIFKSRMSVTADVIQYVWDDRFPEGTAANSPFLGNVKILVVRSGKSNDWAIETRDLLKDYQTLFGRPPKNPLSAIGFMSDSDNTKTQSEIYLRNLSIKKPQANIPRQP